MNQTIILPDGNTFTGEIDQNGIRNGKGVKTYPNGATFEGTWVNNVRHGKGLKTTANGTTKEVEYCNGLFIK
jgi:antitoxin component YwqK of YwqJK toxin-antitoxin module